MKVYRDVRKFKVTKPVLTVGSFDGVHLGHLKVINRLNEIAEQNKGESAIFTFSPHPRLVLNPDGNKLRLLTTLEEKIHLLERSGVQHLIIFPFTRTFSELSYTDFVRLILVGQLNVDCLVVGHDHKFGKDRKGDFEMLKNLSLVFNFKLENLDALLTDNISISSTVIRKSLHEGDIEQANRYLGYTFCLTGTVVEGQKLGRKIQFPTANIEVSDSHKIIPSCGVYAVFVVVEGVSYRGMLNIGTRPTITNNVGQQSIEAHIFNFDENIYKKEVTIRFVTKVRDEKKFASIDGLRAQLEKDKHAVLSLLDL
jgi:riboflavin kinase/FMN adenylyltransferase